MDVDVSDQQDDSYNEIELRNTLDRPVYKLSVRLIDTYKYINKVITAFDDVDNDVLSIRSIQLYN